MRRLLNITMLYHAVFTAMLLIVCAIFFYWMSQSLYTHQIDETLLHKRNNFIKEILPTIHEKDIPNFNHFNPDQQIISQSLIKQSIFKDTVLIDSVEMEMEPYRLLCNTITIDGHAYVLKLRISLLEKEDAISGIAGIFTVFIFILFAGLYIINRSISKKVWRPFYNTINFISDFDIQKQHQEKLPSSSVKEFDQLNQSLNSLIFKTVSSYNYQKEFTENAAHELQTPIAILQFKLDMLLQNESLTNEQSTIIQTLFETVSRLSRINKNLLTLSKIDAQVYQKTEKINLSDFIDNTWKNFSVFADDEQIKFIKEDKFYVVLDVNKDILTMLLNNLFSNAIIHNYTNGKIHLIIEKNKIIISNTSYIEKLPKEKLFKRFSTVNESSKGNGLGLAIIDAICKANNWKVDYNFENNLHQFIIQF